MNAIARFSRTNALSRAFLADRPFALTFALLSLAALAPLLATPALPFADLPSNIASASALVATALGRGTAAQFYEIIWRPFPYWTLYPPLGLLCLAFGPFVAAKLTVGALILALPMAMLRLLIALGRDPRLSLGAFLVVWEHNLYAGWHAYVMAMAVALVTLAKLIEARDEAGALRVVPLSLFLALSHVMAVGFALVAGALLAFDSDRPLRRLKLNAIGLSGSALVLVPWLGQRLTGAGAAGVGPRWRFDYPSVSEKVAGFFPFSLDNLRGTGAECAAAAALLMLLLGPLALACLRSPDRPPHRWSGALLALAALLLYGAAPMAIYGPIEHWFTYPRYASYFLALLPAVPPTARLRFAWMLPGVALALAIDATTFASMHAFGARVAPFLRIYDAAPPGAAVLPLEFVNDDPVTKFEPLAHLHSYLAVKGTLGAFDPHQFDNPNAPIRYRAGLAIPRISWLGPRDFSLTRDGAFYQYVLVQGASHDPFVASPPAGPYGVRLVSDAGPWRLYHVERR